MTATRKRWLVLGPLLLATLTAVVFAPSDETSTQPPRERRAAKAAPPARADKTTSPETALALPDLPPPERSADETDSIGAEHHDPFRVASWIISPPPAPPPEPTAPPLPFKYLGKLIDDGRYIVFLSDKNNYLVAHEGDRIDAWRIEEITPKRMTFLYEPLKKRQELVIGAGDEQ